MKYSTEDIEYLSGKKFSNGYRLHLKNNYLTSRLDFLITYLKGKSVLHIGCCDHIPLIEKKIKDKTWLHGLLVESCKFTAGIDINKEAVDYIKDNISLEKITGVYHIDLINEGLPFELQNTKFDYALLGEILEHVDDPVNFLKETKKRLRENTDKIIVTVPNALCFRSIAEKMINKNLVMEEYINTDHRYWFTPYTIAKVFVQSGIYPEELFFVDPPFPMQLLANKFHFSLEKISYHSTLSDTLALIGKLS